MMEKLFRFVVGFSDLNHSIKIGDVSRSFPFLSYLSKIADSFIVIKCQRKKMLKIELEL